MRRPCFSVLCWRFVAVALTAPIAAAESSNLYLSDAPQRILSSNQAWGKLGLDVAAHEPGQQPLPLRILDNEYTKGLGHHAPGEILFDLDDEFTTFESDVGLLRQGGRAGSVVFQVFVDNEKKFDSGVMKADTPAKKISIPVAGAIELKLVMTDAGDGILNDGGVWGNARLTRVEDQAARPAPMRFNAAPFARVVTSDPKRMTGSRADRVHEYHADDLFIETDIQPEADGTYRVQADTEGVGCIGLRWLERRMIRKLELLFADEEISPSTEGIQVQYWAGESAWQGGWKPLHERIEARPGRWICNITQRTDSDLRGGTRRIRWIIPNTKDPILVRRLTAQTPTSMDRIRLYLQHDGTTFSGRPASIEMYNGELLGPTEFITALKADWDWAKPLRIEVRFSRPRSWKTDRTLIRFTLPTGTFAVAVDDVIERGHIYVKDMGLFICRDLAQAPDASPLEEYKKQIEGKETTLEMVRRLPDQTVEQALAKVHNRAQDLQPTMLSMSCDNAKFVVHRDGRIEWGHEPEKYPFQMIPTLGNGKNDRFERNLEGEWLPIVVNEAVQGKLAYRQRSFVVPETLGQQSAERGDVSSWYVNRSVCVNQFLVTNSGTETQTATIRLTFLSDAGKKEPAKLDESTQPIRVLSSGGEVMAYINVPADSGFNTAIEGESLSLTAELAASGSARVAVFLPRQKGSQPEWIESGDAAGPEVVRTYWEGVLKSAIQIELPDRMWTALIRASQVHCLIPSRNEANGERIAPWIASISYGPLESEANSIIRGMDFLGHHEYARRSLDYFISKYNKEGFLTTGYTLMGTGWHLWALGEHYQLTRDREWMRQVAPEVARVCDWIVRQREKTKKLDSAGGKLPEYGLMPPGVIADWNAFAYHFCLNAYYYGGLKGAAEALMDVGYPDARRFLDNAREFREEIMRAYRWTQARTPAYPLADGTFISPYVSQVHSPGPLNYFFPGEDANRSWCYDVELGAHQLVPLGVMDAHAPGVAEMMDHMEDVQFLSDGWFDFPAERNHKDPFNLGGFAKVQPFYCRNAEIYAARDDVKPYIRSYINATVSLLNRENLSFQEHFNGAAAWNKTHETGYFLMQSRLMLVMERGDELWLAPFVTQNWMKSGMTISVAQAPSLFGTVGYTIQSSADNNLIEAVVEPPLRTPPAAIVIRLRHPDGRRITAVEVNGQAHTQFDASRDIVRIKPEGKSMTIRARY